MYGLAASKMCRCIAAVKSAVGHNICTEEYELLVVYIRVHRPLRTTFTTYLCTEPSYTSQDTKPSLAPGTILVSANQSAAIVRL